MSRYDYRMSQAIQQSDPPFTALIMAAMRKADTHNLNILRDAFPAIWQELHDRYSGPSGFLLSELENLGVPVYEVDPMFHARKV